MSLLQTVVGIDPSGRRLALAVSGGGLARRAAPLAAPLRGDRETALFDEAERILLDYVARHALAGCAARLCVPADRVYMARVVLPPLRDRDLESAISLELERLFPLPASRLAAGWARQARSSGREPLPLVIAAAPSEYLERWREVISRAGLSMIGAVPAGSALLAALERAGEPLWPGSAALVRETGGSLECTLFAGPDPYFCSVRPAEGEGGAESALEMIAAGLADNPLPPDVPLRLFAPSTLLPALQKGAEERGIPLEPAAGFEARAAAALRLPGRTDGGTAPWDILGAFGAAAAERGLDLARRREGGPLSRAAGVLAVALGLAAALLGAAWPASAVWKARQELARIDARVEALRPAVADVEKSLQEIAAIDARIGTLREASAGRAETLLILREVTERLPQGTWLTGLRVEGGKVEMDGQSPSASEIFPLLTRDGRFRNVEFASPITRQADNMERFHIRSESAPPQPSPKEGRP